MSLFRYFLHTAEDWPITGACNREPLGPDSSDRYLATLPATAQPDGLPELTRVEAAQWVASLGEESTL